MLRTMLLGVLLLCSLSGLYAQPLALSIIKTSDARTLEAFTYAGGSYTRAMTLQHVAVLVRHPQGSFLFDTGLGQHVDVQYQQDMPLWMRPFFSYGPVSSARSQLDAAGYAPVGRIVVSHGHWDHVSGLVDFPEAEVWLSQPEMDYLALPHRGAVFPSQVSAPSIRWKPFQWRNTPWGPFAQSLDVFGDGTVVLLPLAGHTPGSIAMHVTLPSGKKYLFVGDAVWNVQAVAQRLPKMWIASRIADSDPAQSLEAIDVLAHLQEADPALVIVPAHDASVHDAIGAYFPHFTP